MGDVMGDVMGGVMGDAKKVHMISGAELPEYPVDLCDPRLSSDYFTVFWHDRWLNSELHLTADMDVQGAALNLFFVSRKQTPVGSLPDNDLMLARLLHIDLQTWVGMRGRKVSPLYNWARYQYGDRIVLGHPVVIEVATDALARRELRKVSNSEKAVSQRRGRLVDMLRGLKLSDALLADKVLIARLDDWLEEHHKGQRRMPQFEASMLRALEHGFREGWM